jgi:uncharacterized membrane protein
LTTEDHNKTLVGIHLAFGIFFAAGLVASPWIIAQNFRNKEKLLLAVFVFGLVSLLTLLMFSTAIAMLKRKPIGKKLALVSAVLLLTIFWPAAVYSWWFMHSDGAKRLYGAGHQTAN